MSAASDCGPRLLSSFFKGDGDHRDLHSFPTRRSSDLLFPDWIDTPCSPRHRAEAQSMRSEEHTSELQSHSDLVCRLLLEKKNCSSLYFAIVMVTPQSD